MQDKRGFLVQSGDWFQIKRSYLHWILQPFLNLPNQLNITSQGLGDNIFCLSYFKCQAVKTQSDFPSSHLSFTVSELGIPVSQQHLIFDGVELSNATLLAAAQISHGALLRLVLGVQSGPLNRDTARTLGSAQPCHRLSAAGRHSVCPLTVPVAPMYRIPATTMVLPVLCTPNRGSGTEHESHHHHQHHQHQHHLYKYHPYHPSFPYLTGSMNTYCSDRILANKTEWDEPTLYTVHEFATDEETTGSGEEAVSDLDEYLEYAIDEDELNLGQSGKGSSRSSPLVDDSYECSDSVVEGRKSLDSPPAALSGPSTFPISASSRSSSTSSSSPSVFSSECQLFPVYSIPSQVQWILGHTNVS